MHNLPTFYHITPEYNAPSILRHGISSSRNGFIYMFEDGYLSHPSGKGVLMSDTIALLLNKIQTDPYFKFQIDPQGFDVLPIRDTAYTLGGGYHWKVKQEVIQSQFIKVVDYRTANKKDAVELRSRLLADRIGIAYTGQSYKELWQQMGAIQQAKDSSFKILPMVDEWKHEHKPPTPKLRANDYREIFTIRQNVSIC